MFDKQQIISISRGEKRVEVEEEIRRLVDNIMREELDLLKMVGYCRDRRHFSFLFKLLLLYKKRT